MRLLPSSKLIADCLSLLAKLVQLYIHHVKVDIKKLVKRPTKFILHNRNIFIQFLYHHFFCVHNLVCELNIIYL